MNPNDTPPQNPAAEAEVELAAAAAAQPSLSAEERLAELEAKHASVSDAYLRAKAEAENTRRRAEEEMSKARKFAVEGFAESLLPVCDSLEAAIALQTPTSRPRRSRCSKACMPRCASCTARWSATRCCRSTRRWAPSSTRTSTRPSAWCRPKQEANTVVSVLQKGYLIADRVLRPALVMVAAPK